MRDAPSSAPCALYRRHAGGEGHTYVFAATLSAAQPGVSSLHYDAGHGFREALSARRALVSGQQSLRMAFRAGRLRALRWTPCASTGCQVTVLDVRLLSLTPGVDLDALKLGPLEHWRAGATTRVRRLGTGYEVMSTGGEAVLTRQLAP